MLTLAFTANYASANPGSLQKFGDIMQVANPIIATAVASQEKGAGHYAVIFAEIMALTHGTKYIAKQNKWSISKRPNRPGRRDRFDGMPSGHTSSAFSAASYVRIFSSNKDNKAISIPLYAAAIATGYSRIESKKHTTVQVIAGALLSEILTELNSRFSWSQEYQSTNFIIGGKEGLLSFTVKF